MELLIFFVAFFIFVPLIYVISSFKTEYIDCSQCKNSGEVYKKREIGSSVCNETGGVIINTWKDSKGVLHYVFKENSNGYEIDCYSCNGSGKKYYDIVTEDKVSCVSCDGKGKTIRQHY